MHYCEVALHIHEDVSCLGLSVVAGGYACISTSDQQEQSEAGAEPERQPAALLVTASDTHPGSLDDVKRTLSFVGAVTVWPD